MSHEQRLTKLAAFTVSLGDPVIAGRYIADIIRFLMARTDPEMMQNLRTKIWELNAAEISSKELKAGAPIGQSINFVKNVLIGQDPAYIRSVINNILMNL